MFGQTLKSTLLAAIFCFLACGVSGVSAADPAAAHIDGTYLQLLDRHTEWDEEDWRLLFDDFKTLRVSELILQWSVSSDLAFYPSQTFHNKGNPPLELIFDLAEKCGIGVRIGLWHDPNFWNNINGPTELLESYLRLSRLRSTTIAREIVRRIRRRSSFRGWYISEEIDDSSWNEPIRRKMLTNHLASLRANLREITPEAAVGISAFSNARLDPESNGEFLETILVASAVDILYFQDGIGVHKLDLNYLPLYLDAATRAAKTSGCAFAVVVELFEQKPEEDGAVESFRAVPAALSRIKQQIELAARYGEGSIMAFSIPDYMSSTGIGSAWSLYREYVRKYIEPTKPGSTN